MSQENVKTNREWKDINEEYQKVCAILGEKQYKLEVGKAEIDALLKKCWELNKEGAAAQERDAKRAERATKLKAVDTEATPEAEVVSETA